MAKHRLINKVIAIIVVIACLSVLLFPLMSVQAKEESSADLFKLLTHSCDNEDHFPDNDSTKSSHSCSLPCNVNSCCVLADTTKTTMINVPAKMERKILSTSEQSKINKIINVIFKPPKLSTI